MSEVRLSKKPMSFSLSLEVEPSESIALHLLVTHDETFRHIAICYDDYKFAAFSHSILQKFAVNEVTCMFHFEIVMTLHNQRTGSYRVLKRNTFITYELDIPCDLDTSLTFSGEDSTRFVTYVFLVLPSPATGSSNKPVPLPPLWFNHATHLLGSQPPP